MNAVAEPPISPRTLTDRLVRARVGISSILFVGLIIHDIIRGLPPLHGWSTSASGIGIVGAMLVIFGLVIRSWAAGILPKGLDLATTGPYSLCRHPLYLGSFAMMVGFCLLLGHLHDYLVMLGPIAGIYYLTMRAEERRLNSVYVVRWEEYRAKVSMFVPWNIGEFRLGRWSAARWMKCREYRAVLGSATALIALEIWRLQLS